MFRMHYNNYRILLGLYKKREKECYFRNHGRLIYY